MGKYTVSVYSGFELGYNIQSNFFISLWEYLKTLRYPSIRDIVGKILKK